MTVEDDIASYEARQERAREREHELKMRKHHERMARIDRRRKLLQSDGYREHKFYVALSVLCAAVFVTIILAIMRIALQPTPVPTPAQLQDKRERYEICMQVEKDQYVCD